MMCSSEVCLNLIPIDPISNSSDIVLKLISIWSKLSSNAIISKSLYFLGMCASLPLLFFISGSVSESSLCDWLLSSPSLAYESTFNPSRLSSPSSCVTNSNSVSSFTGSTLPGLHLLGPSCFIDAIMSCKNLCIHAYLW